MRPVETVIARAWQVLQTTPSALITDIDGTISRIAPTPQEAFVSDGVRDALRAITPHLALTAVVTGREASVARTMVGVEGIEYVGNYALDQQAIESITIAGLDEARSQVASLLGGLPCVEVEDKGVSFSLHYRGCDDRPAARQALLTIAGPIAAGAGAKLVEGKSVLEVVPASLPDKGMAVRRLLDAHGIAGVVYFGDDIGDIAAFWELGFLRENEGIDVLTVAVVDAETDEAVLQTADMTLQSVDDVEAVLTALAHRLAGGAA